MSRISSSSDYKIFFPNKTNSDFLEVVIQSKINQFMAVDLINPSGEFNTVGKHQLEAGQNSFRFNLLSHPSGIYKCKFTFCENSSHEEIIFIER